MRILPLFLISMFFSTQGDGDFYRKNVAVLAEYSPVMAQIEALALEGQLDKSINRLVDHVPVDRRTAVHYFVLGNLLYRLDPTLSHQFHAKAWELMPEEPYIQMELGLQKHRAGDFTGAATLYRQFLKQVANPPVQALLADCLLHLKQPEEAVAAWNKAQHFENHTSIDMAIHWIYGGEDAQQERHRLLGQAPDRENAIALLICDLEWQTDWWNMGVNDAALAFDMPRFRKALTEKEMILVDLAISIRKGQARPEDVEETLLAGNLILNNGALPEHAFFSAIIIDYLLEHKLIDVDTLVASFWETLKKRSFGPAGDLGHLDLLAALAAQKNRDLPQIDRFGFEHYGDRRYMISLLMGRHDQMSSTDPDLLKALQDFPDEPYPWLVAVACAEKEGKPVGPLLVNLIKAEYRGLKSSDARYSYALKEYFEALARVL